MRYEQPIPFYMAYPFLLPLDQEQAQEKDLQVMKSFYSRRAARIQEKADRECDRMEYDGSMMFDEYPDRLMIEMVVDRIQKKVTGEDGELEAEQFHGGMQPPPGHRPPPPPPPKPPPEKDPPEPEDEEGAAAEIVELTEANPELICEPMSPMPPMNCVPPYIPPDIMPFVLIGPFHAWER